MDADTYHQIEHLQKELREAHELFLSQLKQLILYLRPKLPDDETFQIASDDLYNLLKRMNTLQAKIKTLTGGL